ncbi:MAG: FtsW/RodA/SpoVE family cell cycle protein [Erysipelotrichaceae bacterium]|nr:FtsW/RodA/SpoVE family cell cycle protein [Erysipelotrichaceae bacterium]
MRNKFKIAVGDLRITIAAVLLLIYGSMMVASAEMGNSAGDTSYLIDIVIHQIGFAIIGVIVYFALVNVRIVRLAPFIYYAGFFVVAAFLLLCRLFAPVGGAYAWIPIPGIGTIQPSEFAKVFMILFAVKTIGIDHDEDNVKYFWIFMIAAFIMFFIIFKIQHDFGSAIVLFLICYCIAFIPAYKELKKIHIWMLILIVVGIVGAMILLSPPVTELLKKHSDNYMIGRFLASADPFLYQYDNGYHLIMSLVSFANGGWTGLGYGNSIHKYMNFPNPSNDFILPVIVEEFGIIGFLVLIILYGVMLYPLIAGSLRTKYLASKIIFLGVFIYFIAHFILNVGGVSGLIPLTGVPLLLISSGGSSLVASMAALGIAQNELRRNKMVRHENNSGEIQKHTTKDARR